MTQFCWFVGDWQMDSVALYSVVFFQFLGRIPPHAKISAHAPGATMPIYEYQCQACQHAYEEMQKITEAPLTECPACHQPQLQRLVSAAGFQLKGTGWYATDFKNAGKPKSQPPATAKSTHSGAKTGEGTSAVAKEATAGSTDTAKSAASSDKAGTGTAG